MHFIIDSEIKPVTYILQLASSARKVTSAISGNNCGCSISQMDVFNGNVLVFGKKKIKKINLYIYFFYLFTFQKIIKIYFHNIILFRGLKRTYVSFLVGIF